MNHLQRLTAILLQLQSRKMLRAQDIADRFGISIRTVYRDIRVLEEAGVPIGSEAGKGYFIMDGYQLPPVSFSKEEAAALLTGEKLAAQWTDQSVFRHFETAMQKVRAVLRSREKDFLESLEQGMAVQRMGPPLSKAGQGHFLADIQQALVQHAVLELEYYASSKDEVSTRQVEPIGLCQIGNSWHLIAWCRSRQAYRDFRTDRIQKLKVRPETFTPRKDLTLHAYLEQIVYTNAIHRVTVLFKKETARQLGDLKYYYGLIEEKEADGGVQMVFMNNSLEFMGRWLLIYTHGVKVLDPPGLQTIMRSLTRELQEHYG